MLRDCRQCGKMFVPVFGKDANHEIYCGDCCNVQENHYLQIHQFLRENPGSTIEQIAEGTGISLETIQQLHRSGYFQEKRGICAQCKKLTPGGDSVSICRDCRSKVTKELLDTRGISHQEMADNLKQGLKSNRNRSSEKQYGLRSE